MTTPPIPPKGYRNLADFIDEEGRRKFDDAWTGQEANACLLPIPQTDADVLAIIDTLRGNQHHQPLPDDAPPVRDPPRSIARLDWGMPEVSRRAASSLQRLEAWAEIKRRNQEPAAAMERLNSVYRQVATSLIHGDLRAVAGYGCDPVPASWWGDNWEAKLRFGKRDGQWIFTPESTADTATAEGAEPPSRASTAADVADFTNWALEQKRTIAECEKWAKDRGLSRTWMREQRRQLPPAQKRAAGEK